MPTLLFQIQLQPELVQGIIVATVAGTIAWLIARGKNRTGMAKDLADTCESFARQLTYVRGELLTATSKLKEVEEERTTHARHAALHEQRAEKALACIKRMQSDAMTVVDEVNGLFYIVAPGPATDEENKVLRRLTNIREAGKRLVDTMFESDR